MGMSDGEVDKDAITMNRTPNSATLVSSTATSDGDDAGRQRRIYSLSEFQVQLSEEMRSKLQSQYLDDDKAVSKILKAMKHSPSQTICRVNKLLSTREEVLAELKSYLLGDSSAEIAKSNSADQLSKVLITEHEIFDDVVVISEESNKMDNNSTMPPLYHLSIPLQNDSKPGTDSKVLFDHWPSRKTNGWPMTHRVVICDRFCGEAILRGSDIFVKGVLVADRGIEANEEVAVYAEIPILRTKKSNGKAKKLKKISRGLVLERYEEGQCVFLGLGIAQCSRQDMFRLEKGVGVKMCYNDPSKRVQPFYAPPLSGILENKMMLQNLPSIMVGHVLNPQRNEVILDMCCAPGGKSAHLASLVGSDDNTTIVSCDKSCKKLLEVKTFFESLNAKCITPLNLDTTKCCIEEGEAEKKSVKGIIDLAPIRANGLKDIKGFPPKSFDRILLDPPCSALGLRPKLFIPQQSGKELTKSGEYQKKFIEQAARLLKPGGYMTYSTCTINALENECIVSYALQEIACEGLELIPIPIQLGQKGLRGHGLNEEQCNMVRRFDPSLFGSSTADDDDHLRNPFPEDTMGFFLALFRKKKTEMKRKRSEEEEN